MMPHKSHDLCAKDLLINAFDSCGVYICIYICIPISVYLQKKHSKLTYHQRIITT